MKMIRQILFPLVFLVTAVVSTSNIQHARQTYNPLINPEYYKQTNTYTPPLYRLHNNLQEYGGDVELTDVFNPNHRISKGHRNQQWHNYPRQMDRLEKYYDRHKTIGMNKLSYRLGLTDGSSDEEMNSLYDVLQSQMYTQKPGFVINDPETLKKGLQLNSNFGFDKLKRSDPENIDKLAYQDLEGDPESWDTSSNSPQEYGIDLNKRMFSLWSRLNGMAPRGHELHHRRYLHAYYGIPENMVNEHFSAETRSELRPPGSPLRWG